MYRIHFYLFLLLSIATNVVTAQNYQGLINVGFKSPGVASLDKFGNIPVSYSTGVPSITIPIFQVKAGDIMLPISLDYHASGIRVDEVSSSIGIGWALNAGGSVSRSMVGMPDEYGYLTSPPFDQAYNNQRDYYQYFYSCVKGQNETTPDIFNYSAGGQSGRFIIKKADHSFIQFPLTNNKIETLDATNYKITDQNGICYIFDRPEYSTLGGSDIPIFTSAWRLTKIISSSKRDTVYLQYDSGTIVQRAKSYSHTLGSSGSGAFINEDNYRNVANSNTESYVKEIRWRGGKISFLNTDGRSDAPGGKRVSQISVYAKSSSSYSLLKTVVLDQSYFYYKPANYSDSTDPDGADPYRLRLDKATFLDANGSQPQIYTMTYDQTPMAPRESAGQDIWGFNNGHFENTTLMPYHNEYYVGDQASGYFAFGSANRQTDESYIKACSIQSITYPTGGKTVYQLEPHQYDAPVTRTVNSSVSSTSDGSFRSSNSVTFVLTSDMAQLQYRYSISKFAGYSDISNRPECTLTDQTTGSTLLRLTNPDPNNNYNSSTSAISSPTGPFLTVGHTYVVTTNIYTSNPNVKATLDILYITQQTTNEAQKGGGLRIKSVSNYDNNGSLINAKSYDYGTMGSGVLLTQADYLEQTSESVYYNSGCPYVTAGHETYTYRANSVVPISQYSGSPVVYSFVTEYEVGNGGHTNGKKTFLYDVITDNNAVAGVPNVPVPSLNSIRLGAELISNVWRNGYLIDEATYKSNGSDYKLTEWISHIYANERRSEEQMLRVRPRIFYQQPGCAAGAGSATTLSGDVIIDSYMLPTFAILIKSDTVRNYDDAGRITALINNYAYSDLTHLLPTRQETINSKQKTLAQTLKYPHDYASGANAYQAMVDRNILSPVVSTQRTSDGMQISTSTVNYRDWFGNGLLLMPESADQQVGSYAVERRVNFNRYDQYGNILEQQKTNGSLITYLWGYNSQYPIAKVENASYQDVVNVLGQNTIDQLAGSTSADDNQVRVALNVLRTDSRLKNALVTTYAYSPLVGMTSMTDSKGMTTTYEYDSFQRLMNVKDKDGNIVKHTDYHYQNQ